MIKVETGGHKNTFPPDLPTLRKFLEEWNNVFFKLLKQRQGVVKDLQKLKRLLSSSSSFDPSLPQFPFFDHHREKQLFLQFQQELKKLSLKELLAFSLIMEAHASQGKRTLYPLWSERIHIRKTKVPGSGNNGILEMINPFLLQVTHQRLLRKVDMKKAFFSLL